ncbi:MAG TPA: DMT family transporter [Gemmatimonadaceae bacterium]|nr:DMT family transporter [Gemmatimonadaceae bacterium]
MSISAATAPATPAVPVDVIAPRQAEGFGRIDLLMLLMAALWGANFFAVQYGTAHMPGLAFNTSRMTLGALVMLGIALVTVREPWPSRADTLRLLAYGVIGNGIYQYMFVQGLSRARGGSASLILAASPAALAILGWATRTEKMTRLLVAGVLLSVAGVAMVMLGDNATPGHSGTWLGSVYLAMAVITWAVYVTLLRPLTQRVGGLQLTLITLAGGLLPLYMLTGRDVLAAEWMALTWRTWAAMAYSGVGAIAIAYLIYYHGLKTLGPTRTSLYANLQPFVAILVAWQFQNDRPTIWQLMGFLCITGGVLLARRAK